MVILCYLKMHIDFRLCREPKWYMCKDQTTCIHHNVKCDGHFDCPEQDDEKNCIDYVAHHEEVKCLENEFSCESGGICLPIDNVCNGVPDCLDGSDEKQGCDDIAKKCKGFLCKNKHCISDKTWVCDGFNDCGDNSDEEHCGKLRIFNISIFV